MKKSKNNKIKLMYLVTFLLIIVSFVFCIKNNTIINIDYNNKIKSANLSTDYDIKQVVRDIELLELNTVNVPIIINIENLSSSDFYIDKESEYKAIKLIKKLKKKNIKIILEAYPWIDNGNEYETKWNPSDKEHFFNNWKNNVICKLLNEVAIPLNVDIINIASNLNYLEHYEKEWCAIIKFVKSKFKGAVTYRTSWWYTSKQIQSSYEIYNNKLENKIFDLVDFISIAAYFELSDKSINTVDDLVNSLSSSTVYNRNQNIKEEIFKLHQKHKKPIFFGELGFVRREKTSFQPWNPIPSEIKNNEEQARCFEAYKIVFEDKKWMKGFSIFCVGKVDEYKNFYPSKESMEVIKSWYK